MTITSLCYINTDVKPQPSHLFFRQDSVNQNTQTQVRTFTLFSKFEIEHYKYVKERHSLKVFFTYRLKLNTMKVLVVLALAVFTGEKFREHYHMKMYRGTIYRIY